MNPPAGTVVPLGAALSMSNSVMALFAPAECGVVITVMTVSVCINYERFSILLVNPA